MGSFDDAFKQELIKQYSLSTMLALILSRKFVELGYISISNAKLAFRSIRAQLDKVESPGSMLTSLEDGNLSISLDDDILNSPYIGQFVSESINISSEDIDRVQEFILESMTKTAIEALKSATNELIDGWEMYLHKRL